MRIYSLALLAALVGCGGSSSSSDDPAPVPTPDVGEEDQGTGEVMFGADVFLRGDMNEWSAPEEAKFAFVDGCYTLDLEIAAETYNFKVASEDWVFANIGGYVDEVTGLVDPVRSSIAPGESLTVNARLVQEGDSPDEIQALPDPKNLTLTVTEDQLLNFQICFPQENLEEIVLTVSPVE